MDRDEERIFFLLFFFLFFLFLSGSE